MVGPENPYDTTIPDPFDPERAIEDPMHGPSAVHAMLEIPEMPDGTGVYYRPGLGPFGPDHFNAQGQPLPDSVGSASNDLARTREMLSWAEWTEAYHNGGEPMLTILEGERQRARLAKTGVAHSFKPSDVCGGGKRLDECETAGTMIQAAQEYVSSAERSGVPNEGKMWNTLAWLGKSCVDCSLYCEVAYETYDGVSNGIIRFSNVRPLELDVPVLRIDRHTP